MKKYTLKRIITSLFTLLAILLVLFILMQLMPGSPFNDEKLTPEMRASLYAKYGLDQPIYVQFFRYVTNMLRGDFGVSYNISKNTPISQLIQSRLPMIPEYSDRARISIGVELGLRTDYHHSIEDFAEVCAWDFIIGSTHVVNGLDPYYPQYWEGKSKQQGIMEYYETTLANIRKLDCFDVYGHIDYIVRYAPNQRENYSILDYKDIIDEILKLLIQNGKGIECNTAGFKYGLGVPNPENYVLKRYHELGNILING